jgi:fluoroquinolone transport system permease protein
LRNIARDSMLRFLLLYPFIIGLLMRWLVPAVTQALAGQLDLVQYYPLLGGFFALLIMPALTGTVVGFMLLDERDSGTLRALQVTPLSMGNYLLYRAGFQVVLCVAGSYIITLLMGVIAVPWVELLPLALLAALEAPLFAMLFASLATNKVQGVAVMKGLSLLMVLPFVAWFVPEPWQWLFGIVPTYWPLKASWLLLAGEPYAWTVVAGLLLLLAYLLPLLRFFRRRIYQA